MLEILLMSSFMVIVNHIVLPTLAMPDVHTVKKRLLKAMQDYQKNIVSGNVNGVSRSDIENQSPSNIRKRTKNEDSIKNNHNFHDSDGDADGQSIIKSEFNASEYFYLSFKIAQHYESSLRAAKIILRYSTPW